MPDRKRIALFFLINLFLCAWHLDSGQNDNVMSRAAMVAALVEHGTLRIDAYPEATNDKVLIDGHYYSDKAPLPALIVLPFWWIADRLGRVTPGDNGMLTPGLIRLGGFLCGSLPLAIIITLLWLELRQRKDDHPFPAWMLAALPIYGSFLFVFSGAWFGHLSGAVLMLFAFRASDHGSYRSAGAFAAAAVVCEYPLIVFPAFWFLSLLLQRKWRCATEMAIGALPLVLGLLWYNQALTGDPLSIGYDHEAQDSFGHNAYGFGLPSLKALWGLTFSEYRGLFFYMPVLLLSLIAMIRARTTHELLRDPILVPAAIDLLVICSVGMWWGGWTYGPRHLTTVAVLLAYRSFQHVASSVRSRWTFAALSAFGSFCAFAAKDTVWFSLPTESMHPILDVVLPALGRSHTPMQWPVLAGLTPMASSIAFLVVFGMGMFALRWIDRSSVPTPS